MWNTRRRALLIGLLVFALASLAVSIVSADPPDPKTVLPPVPNAPLEPPRFDTINGPNGPRAAVDLTADEDAWVGSGPNYANQNRGGDQSLYVGWDNVANSQAERGLLYFKVNSIPSNAIVDSASMSLTQFASQGGSVMTVVARRITGSWREASVTWNTLPTYDNATNWASTNVSGASGVWQWDLTELTRRWASGEYNNQGVIMVGDETPRVAPYDRTFRSREYSNSSDRPRLFVTYGLAQMGSLPAFASASFPVTWNAGGASSSLRWDVQYHQRSPSGGYGDWVTWQTATDRTQIDFQGDHNQVYQFRVRAVYTSDARSGWSDASSEVWVDRVAPTVQYNPPVPATSGPDFVISWQGADDGTGIQNYDVEIYDNEVPYRALTTTDTSITLTGGLPGHVYGFRVRSRDRAGNVSDWTTARTTIISPKPQLSINTLPPISPSAFTVSWNVIDTGGGIASFNLEIWDNGVFSRAVQTTTPSYFFTGGQDGHAYSFRVQATSVSGGVSDFTNFVNTRVDAAPPTVSIAADSRYQTGTTINVHWSGRDSVSDVASYDVQVSTNGGAWQNWQTGISATSGVYVGATGNSYRFRVRARDMLGNESSFTPDDQATVTVALAMTSGRVLGNRGLPIGGAVVSSSPSALNNNTTSGGQGDYYLYWNALDPRAISAAQPQYLQFSPINVQPAVGQTPNVDIYLRPSNDIIANGGFEAQLTGWTTAGGVTADGVGHSGSVAARLQPSGRLSQRVTAPAGGSAPVLSFLYKVESGGSGNLIVSFEDISTGGPNITNVLPVSGTGWQHAFYDLRQLQGAQFTVAFTDSTSGGAVVVSLDEISLGAGQANVYPAFMPIVIKNSHISGRSAKTDTPLPMPAAPTPAAPDAPTPVAPATPARGPVIDLREPARWTP